MMADLQVGNCNSRERDKRIENGCNVRANPGVGAGAGAAFATAARARKRMAAFVNMLKGVGFVKIMETTDRKMAPGLRMKDCECR